MHTLTGCIAPNDPFVTPGPDKRLATDASFTLTEPISKTDEVIPVAERPHDLDVIWAYGSRGNVLRIDDELIQYEGFADFKFIRCRRGAFGTKPQRHEKGVHADHLFVRYGCFLPDESSTLVDDIAQNIASVLNTCGFDMIYMDGAEGMPGDWYGISRMRAAIFRQLKRRVLVEASEWGYHSWPFHSRIGAWDYPNWRLKRFIDAHCKSNEEYRTGSFLPAQLGWWAIFGPSEDRYAEMPDEVEYLCAKSLAYDMPMSFQGIGVGQPENDRQAEYLTMIGRYERLRLARYFSEALRARLRSFGQDYHLIRTADGVWEFIPTDYISLKVTGLQDGSSTWTVHNRFKTQPLKLRIQALDNFLAHPSIYAHMERWESGSMEMAMERCSIFS